MYLFENLVSQAVEKAKDKKTRVVRSRARQWKKLKTRKRAQSGPMPGSGKSERRENARSLAPCRAVEKVKDKKTRVTQFASQQADFNRNAGQHMTNLRVDIAEIDDEIEDIMGISKPNDVTEIKAAADNCNEEIHMVEPVNDLVG